VIININNIVFSLGRTTPVKAVVAATLPEVHHFAHDQQHRTDSYHRSNYEYLSVVKEF
jgi:hypothetical protein